MKEQSRVILRDNSVLLAGLESCKGGLPVSRANSSGSTRSSSTASSLPGHCGGHHLKTRPSDPSCKAPQVDVDLNGAEEDRVMTSTPSNRDSQVDVDLLRTRRELVKSLSFPLDKQEESLLEERQQEGAMSQEHASLSEATKAVRLPRCELLVPGDIVQVATDSRSSKMEPATVLLVDALKCRYKIRTCDGRTRTVKADEASLAPFYSRSDIRA